LNFLVLPKSVYQSTNWLLYYKESNKHKRTIKS